MAQNVEIKKYQSHKKTEKTFSKKNMNFRRT